VNSLSCAVLCKFSKNQEAIAEYYSTVYGSRVGLVLKTKLKTNLTEIVAF